ncbi:hypothetical protein CPB86DRAFT_269470 [Serendipita vermifera]|nr:hypothetical protein CPB86DRAFT_269470 [Serendipita vermifera]
MDNLEEAAKLQVKVLELVQELLGEQHPHTISSFVNLAITYQRMGKLGEAKELCGRAEGIAVAVFGEQHPEYLWVKGVLDDVEVDMHRQSERLTNAPAVTRISQVPSSP